MGVDQVAKGIVTDYLADQQDFGWTDGLTHFHENEAGNDHFIDQASRSDAIRELGRSITKPDAVILEIGCSSGYMLEAISEAFPSATLLGADIVREPLEALAKRMPSVSFMRFDLTLCPLPDESVDAVVLLNVLEHIENDSKAMQQINRILKPGGVAIIEVPAGPGLYDIYDKMLMHFRRYNKKSLEALVKTTGMLVQRSSHLGCIMYPGFWLVKKRNQKKFMHIDQLAMSKQVAGSIRNTRKNYLLIAIMKIELLIGRWIHWPVGIRCLLTCRKPA